MAGKPEVPETPVISPSNFEQSLAQLEALVEKLETGDLPLDAALTSFEQGVHLTRECQGALSAAQQKVQVLLQRGEGLVMEEFEPIAGGEPDAAE
jgi:exodeoxyribonuclease VII small subunit